MKISNLKLSQLFFIFTIGILLFISYFSFQRIRNLIDSSNLVAHTNEVRFDLESVMSELKDAETGQRGFLITRDSFYLAPAFGTKGKVAVYLNKLDSLTKDNSLQQKNLIVLRALTKLRFQILETSLITSDSISKKSFRKSFAQGKDVMDEIRNVFKRMMDEENRLLQLRVIEHKRFESVTPVFLLVLTLFSLVLTSSSYFIIRGQLREKTEFQKELENKITDLNRSNSELEQFAYVASHDLQEPLRKIQSFGDKLIRSYKENLPEDGRFIVDRMRNAAERMQGLINDLLSFSRLVQHTRHKEESVSLNAVISNIISDFQLVIEAKKAKINISILPVLHAVPSQIHQLFQNLIANALKFSKPDVAPEITIKCNQISGNAIEGIPYSKRENKYYQITVSDNGIGFDEQYNEKIFVIFQRLHGKLEYEGTGIGLAVCKKIVVNHNGFIRAISKPGKGSKFSIYFPVNQINKTT